MPDLEQDITFPDLNEDAAPFQSEPTDEMFVQTLTEGIADGTLPLSESDSDEYDEDNSKPILIIQS